MHSDEIEIEAEKQEIIREAKTIRPALVQGAEKLKDILKRHRKGEPVFREIVARIEERERKRIANFHYRKELEQ